MVEAARGNIDIVAADRLQRLCEDDSLVRRESAFHPVGRRNADAHRLVRGPGRTHCLERLEREPHAILQRSAILVRPLVRQGRKELVNQVAVAAMHLDKIETDALGDLDRTDMRSAEHTSELPTLLPSA